MFWKALLAASSPIVLVLATAGTSDATTDATLSTRLYDAQACLSCHVMSTGLNHPNGLPTKNSANLPLSVKGSVDCLTCHSEQARNPDHSFSLNGNSVGRDPMLRAKPRVLCASCHDPATNPATVLGHGLAMGKAHLQFDKPFASARLDPESKSCLGCHDGIAAAPSGVRLGGGPSHSTYSSIRSNHPIGVDYNWIPKGTMAPQYHPEATLPDQIRLFKGRLGCGSCHSTYAEKDHMLAGDPKRGTLCLACHIK